MSAPLLEVDDLRVVYSARRREVRAVDGVNLTIGEGEIVALIGESGCGKSTLARALVGLVQPTSGEVRFRGAPLNYSTRALREYRRGVQLILQDPGAALNPRQTVYDAVAEGPRLHGLRDRLDATVGTALSSAGLRPPDRFTSRYPHELSGGQQQRVVMAGALALSPRVLIADEPVSSLDASVRGEILRLFLTLRDEQQVSSLIVSHDLGLAWNVADRVAVMYLGRIVEIGTVDEVLLRPQHPYTRALLAAAPAVHRGTPVAPLGGEAPDPAAIPSGCRFRPRCPQFAALADNEPRAALCHGVIEVLPAGSGQHLTACAVTGTETTEETPT